MLRNGTGRIIAKPPSKSQEECLTQITNNLHTRSQVGSDKAQRLTQLGSSICSKHTSQTHQAQNLEHIFSRALDLDPSPQTSPQEQTQDPGSIVRKLTCLNNIFKELKMLKDSEIPFQTLRVLSAIQDKFIAIEREILKTTRVEQF